MRLTTKTKMKWKHKIEKLIYNKELRTHYTQTSIEVSLKHHQSNSNYKSLRTSTDAHTWRSWDGVKTLVDANPRRDLGTNFTMQNFGPLALTCGYRFIVQCQPLQVVPIDHFPHEVSLTYPCSNNHILYSSYYRSLGLTHRT